jgi:superfamily II DNA/RNA helicase
LKTDPARLEKVARITIAKKSEDIAKLDFVGRKSTGGKLLPTKGDMALVFPKPFQRLAIPYALSGANVIIASETGSGKTLVFLMAVFMKAFSAPAQAKPTGLRALVIIPTGVRPLVSQHVETFANVAQYLKETDDPFWKNVAAPRDSVAMRPEKLKDDDRLFQHALIRIDTADRIKASLEKFSGTDGGAGRVQVIAIDEVDKCWSSTKDKSDVERIVMQCPSAQIISASATIVRQSELSKQNLKKG